MRSGTFRYEVDAGADRAAAIRAFTDLMHHDELHPLIESVREVDPPDGVRRRYRITDRLAVGPVRFPITYTADLISVSDDRVVMVALQRPSTQVHNETRLIDDGGRLRAEVVVTLTAPALFFRYAFDQAERAHRELAKRLSALLTR